MSDCISICMILALMIALFNMLYKAFPPSVPAMQQVRWRGVEPDVTGSARRERLFSKNSHDVYK